MAKKIMSLMLAVCMVLCLMPTAVFAEGSTVTADITGSGASDDPYLIYTASGLKAFRDKVNGQNGLTKQPGAHAKLMNDIVLNDGAFDANGNYTKGASGKDAEKWTPIGYYKNDSDKSRYAGTFDGDGHTVKGLYVKDVEYAGLFGYAMNATIKNVAVDGYITTERYSGGIAGYLSGGSVTNCFNYCTLNSNSTSGGIAGYITEQCKITACGNAGTVNGTDAGGVVGYARNKCVIQNCYNVGAVSAYYNVGAVSAYYVAGGIAGNSANSSIIACYNTGTVAESESAYVSAYVGGIIGNAFNSGSIYFCYWLKGTARNAAGFDPEGNVFTPEAKSKAEFADGTVLALLKKGETLPGYGKCDFPWEKCGYLNAVGMIVPLLKGQTADTFPIYTAEDLKTFRDMVNGGETDAFAKLMNDIDLGGEKWTPIANYTGTFDGNGKTISGLNVKDVINAGLFGTLSGNAVVKNLTVAGSVEASNTDGDSYAGGIAARMGGSAQIIDCVNNATVKATVNNDVDVEYRAYAGGMAGHVEGSVKINGCTNNGTVNANGNMASAYTGGMAGYTEGVVVIANCLNTAALSAATVRAAVSTTVAFARVGGMVGCIDSGSTLTGCYNTGTVTATTTGEKPGQPHAGGMVGVVMAQIADDTITGCGNAGAISATGERDVFAGGIAGEAIAQNGRALTVSSCYSTGSIAFNGDPNYGGTGGIAGRALHSGGTFMISHCYWLEGTCSSYARKIYEAVSVTNTEAHSRSDFANGTVLELLKQNDTTNAWDVCGYVAAADMTLPLLKWQVLNARKYDIYITGVQITSLNQNDVLGDGTVSFVYDEANKKGILTLNGVNIVCNDISDDYPIYAPDMENLEIVLKGKNNIEAEWVAGIMADNLTFSGEGSIEISTDGNYNWPVSCDRTFTVNGGNVKISSIDYALLLDGALTVNGGTLELIASGEYGYAIDIGRNKLNVVLADDRIIITGNEPDGSDAQETDVSEKDTIKAARYVKILSKYIPIVYEPGQYGTGDAVTQNKTYGEDFGLADALFTRTGYTQIGWALSDGGDKAYELGSAYSGNEPLTLYPVWEMEQYSITYDLGGGKLDDSAPRTYMYGDTVTLPIPTKTGYTFDGWYKNSEMTGDKVTEITSTQTGDIELYAKWNECTHDWDSQKNGGWNPVNGSDDGHERICGKCSFTESGLCSKVSSNWAMEQDEHVKRCNTCKRELDRSADHKWGDWKIVKQATCTEPGKKEHTCEYCGITANEVIKSVGHSKSDKLTYSLGGDTHWYTCKNCDAKLDEVKHTFDKTKVDDKYPASPATCTAPAKYYKSCECGAYTTDETFEHGEPNGHKWGDWKQLDSPTCTDNGAEIRECSVCHAKESKNIDPNGHDWENDYTVDKEPTCTKDGSKSIHCKNCDAVKDSTTINALGHTFGEWKTISAPTCTAAGNEKRVCTDCDYSETRTVDANGHKWENDYTVDKEPTCTKDGSKSIHCKNCDAVKDSKTIDALGHSFGEWSTVKQPTCTENGTKERICTVCQHKESKEIKATGHSTGKADCIHKAVCENCGDEYGDLNPDNHSNLIHINGNEATHLKEGNIEYWYCEGCHKYFVKDGDGYKEITESETKTPKTTDHKPNETGWNKDDEYHWYVCECGEVLNKDKHDCRHEVVNERCDKPGREYEQCMVCGYVGNEKAVAPKPHSYGNWIIIKKPTATSKGEQKRSCTVCGNEEVEELPIDNSQSIPNPATGVNDNNILLWIILMFMGCGLFVSDRLFGRKKRRNK